MHTLGCEIWLETMKNMEKKKCKPYDIVYGEKTENHGKCETHKVGHEIWRETLKNVTNEKSTLYDLEYGK